QEETKLTYSVAPGRPKVNFEIHQPTLRTLYESEGLSFDQLSEYLLSEHQIQVTARTIKRRFQVWGIRKRHPPIVLSDELKKRIQVLFFEIRLDDKDMLHVLQQEGFQIGKYALVRLRFELNLRRREYKIEQQQEADIIVRNLVAQELEKGAIDGYGRRYLYTYFRQRGFICARDRLFQ